MKRPNAGCSSCLFRIPPGTKRVLWQITNRCNYSCRYCIFSSSNRVDLRELPAKFALDLVKDLKELGFTHLKLTGGEPFLRQDILKVTEQAAAFGLQVDISTNASVVTKSTAAFLKDTLQMVHVGLDGPDRATQEAIRGKGSFEPTIKGVRHLVKAGIYVRLGCALYRGNDQKLEEMVRFCADLGCREIIFSRMEPVGRMKNDGSLISAKPDSAFESELESLRNVHGGEIRISSSFHGTAQADRPQHCPGGKDFLYINNHGKAAPCTWAVNLSESYLTRETIEETALAALLKTRAFSAFSELKSLSGAGCPCSNI